MKSIFINIIFLFVLSFVICESTNAQTTNRQQNSTDSPCRIIIDFDSNIVPNDNQIIAVNSIKSKELQNMLCLTNERLIIEAVYDNRYLNGKLKPEFQHSNDGGWYMIESDDKESAKKLITSLQSCEGIKKIYLEEPELVTPYGSTQAGFPYSNQWHLSKARDIHGSACCFRRCRINLITRNGQKF